MTPSFPRLILTFEVTESRFDRDSAGSEVEEEEVGEGTPQSNAMTEGDYIPDSPASSPIELKQELPKYLPALQVEDLLEGAWAWHTQVDFRSCFTNMVNICSSVYAWDRLQAEYVLLTQRHKIHVCVWNITALTSKRHAWSTSDFYI